jgi:hypothetical protein
VNFGFRCLTKSLYWLHSLLRVDSMLEVCIVEWYTLQYCIILEEKKLLRGGSDVSIPLECCKGVVGTHKLCPLEWDPIVRREENLLYFACDGSALSHPVADVAGGSRDVHVRSN